jgi:hypothetical protein
MRTARMRAGGTQQRQDHKRDHCDDDDPDGGRREERAHNGHRRTEREACGRYHRCLAGPRPTVGRESEFITQMCAQRVLCAQLCRHLMSEPGFQPSVDVQVGELADRWPTHSCQSCQLSPPGA